MHKSIKRKTTRWGAAVLSAAVIASSVATGAALTPAAADNTEGMIPSRVYGVKIVDTDDYINAVRHTIKSTAAVRAAEDAVKRTDSRVDLSESEYFPAIGSQGGIGSCCAWSNVYYQFTYEMNKALGKKTTPQNTFQPLFIYNLIVGGNNRGSQPWDIYELLGNNGCPTYATVSNTTDYKTWNPDYTTWREANQYRISNYMYYADVGYKESRITSVDDSDIAAIKATLRNGDIISFMGYIWSYKTKTLKAYAGNPAYNKGVVGESVVYKQVGYEGCHEMTIVGYDDNIWTDINDNGAVDDGEMGAFKMANSHGTDYANKGFCWMAYDCLNQESAVEGIGYEKGRTPAMRTFVKLNVDKDFKSSNIYLKYTLNTNNRTDSYLSITATRKKDGVKFTKTTAPYFQITQQGAQALSYDGTTNANDGTMIVDLDNVIAGLDSNNFNDYNWSVSFTDNGKDTAALTVKDAVIIDETGGRSYALNTSFPFTVNSTTKTVALKNYFQFSKLTLTAPENTYVDSEVRFVAKAENESRGSSPIKYNLVITRDGKVVANKYTKGIAIDTVNKTNTIKVGWTPTKAGDYTATLTATDATGILISRTTNFKVYNKQLALRSIDISTDRNVPRYEKVVIKPHVTGGTGKYTYSYYYQKGSKTYAILENTQKTSVTRQFGNTGTYKLIVKVKDSSGKAVDYSRYIVVQAPEISRIHFSYDYGAVNSAIAISCFVKNMPSVVTDADYTCSVTNAAGTTEVLAPRDIPLDQGRYLWSIKANGKYTVKVSVKYKDKLLAEKTVAYEAGTLNENADKYKINVNIISYIINEKPTSPFQIHYWGGTTSGVGDVTCTPLSTTKVYNVGFWSSSQTFYQYVAYIPKDATGFKFHIGNRWFPDGVSNSDGNTKTQNTVYVFNYDYDRCLYKLEN